MPVILFIYSSLPLYFVVLFLPQNRTAKDWSELSSARAFLINNSLLSHCSLTRVPELSPRELLRAVFPQLLLGYPEHQIEGQRGRKSCRTGAARPLEMDSLSDGALTFLVTAGSR